MNQTSFIQKSHIPASLIKSVIHQVGGWDYFADCAPDMSYGADGGWPGFSYYTDTVSFFKKNRRAILELLARDADDFGESAISLIQGFNCLRDYKPTQDEIGHALYGRTNDPEIPNALAWYALESVARSFTDLQR